MTDRSSRDSERSSIEGVVGTASARGAAMRVMRERNFEASIFRWLDKFVKVVDTIRGTRVTAMVRSTETKE